MLKLTTNNIIACRIELVDAIDDYNNTIIRPPNLGLCIHYKYYFQRELTRAANYIAKNLQNSHFVKCFCVLCNTPADLPKVPFQSSICI